MNRGGVMGVPSYGFAFFLLASHARRDAMTHTAVPRERVGGVKSSTRRVLYDACAFLPPNANHPYAKSSCQCDVSVLLPSNLNLTEY
jgi:hypothetical protein